MLLQVAAPGAGQAHNQVQVPVSELGRLGLSDGSLVRLRGKRRTTTVAVVKVRWGPAAVSVVENPKSLEIASNSVFNAP